LFELVETMASSALARGALRLMGQVRATQGTSCPCHGSVSSSTHSSSHGDVDYAFEMVSSTVRFGMRTRPQ
tara:strand:- start:427 stop:639 length:213 start_codon:yes stop_codon:yes gene_type:complete